MGRIDRVVLHNFKSYSGTHTLGPLTDFTAVIGPNGAGQTRGGRGAAGRTRRSA